MTKLDKLKLRLNIADNSQDALLNMFIEDAVDKVRLYLNYRNEESLEAFDGTVIQIATVLYKAIQHFPAMACKMVHYTPGQNDTFNNVP